MTEVQAGVTTQATGAPAPAAAVAPQIAPTAATPAIAPEAKPAEQQAGLPSILAAGKDQAPKGEHDAALDGLTLAEGSRLDAQQLDAVKSYAKANGLTTDQAKTLLGYTESSVVAHQEAWSRQVQDWVGSLVQHPEFGKDLPGNQALYTKGLDLVFPDPEFRKMLESTGYVSYPPLVLALTSFARRNLSEPTHTVRGSAPTAPTADDKARTMFANSPEMFANAGR